MRIRQIVVAAQVLQPSSQLLADVFALEPPYADPGVAEFGIHNAVFAFGDQFIEVISPTQANTACGRHLAKEGDSGYMVILQTDSLARERERFASLGVRSVWQIDLPDISAMHLHPKDVGAAIVSLDEPRPPASWRWGGPQWRVAPGPAGAQRVLGITLRSANAKALATRWAEVLGRPAPQAVGEVWRVGFNEGFVDVASAPGHSDGVTGFSLQVADTAAVLARAQAAGLAVEGQAFHALGVRWALS